LNQNEVYNSLEFQFWSFVFTFELLIPRVTFVQSTLGQIELLLGFLGVGITSHRTMGATAIKGVLVCQVISLDFE
jgi:hypothetical protein